MALTIRQKFVNKVTQRLPWLPKAAVMPIAVALVAIPALGALAFSYGSVISVQSESGTLTGGTSVVADAGASGGQSIKFSSGGGGGARSCPAYPAFPDANCTGTLPGASLNTCSSNINTPNVTLDGCLFDSGLAVNPSAKNVTITNSKIRGTVYCATSNCTNMNLSMTDVEIDGEDSDADALGGIFGYSCLRCNVHDASKGFAGGNFTIVDSYVHDIYGVQSCVQFPGDCQSHNEAILPFDGDNNTLLHNNLNANYSPSSSGGGMSAAIALYTHSSFWGGINNVLIEKNRIANTESPYCAYLGNTSDSDGNPSNLRVIDNVFVSCTEFLGWLRGNGNVWTNNTFSGGQPIPEPSTSEYQ